ncbi:MAG: hypothetical protein QMC95_06565 [Desulfitobacteriaceae bacterium]|nr:hypothetical protein [Desulfitobacteriaceae bacterium]
MGQNVEVFAQAVIQVVNDEYPDLPGSSRFPVKAKVIGVHVNVADIQVLDKLGNLLESIPPIPAVPIPDRLTGLKIGDLVRVGFYYNDPSLAFIEDMA